MATRTVHTTEDGRPTLVEVGTPLPTTVARIVRELRATHEGMFAAAAFVAAELASTNPDMEAAYRELCRVFAGLHSFSVDVEELEVAARATLEEAAELTG